MWDARLVFVNVVIGEWRYTLLQCGYFATFIVDIMLDTSQAHPRNHIDTCLLSL
jgi:hypothetical protein